MNIHQKSFNQPEEPIFSILLPTWNNLEFLKLCVSSIRKNSRFKHQIIIHINEGIDGSLAWVNEQKIDHTWTETNIGVCYAVNASATLVKADYIVYMNDDMYVCPDWDFFLFEEIKQYKSELFFFSATLIEPRYVLNSSSIAPFNYGTSPSDFEELKLLSEYNSHPYNDWNGASWPPNVVHRNTWNLIGGYSTEFTPGMYSDPDFSLKLWNAGCRNFKGISKSRVYHFMSKSTGKLRLKTNTNGKKQFLYKWGITARMFYVFYLKMGSPYQGLLSEPIHTLAFKLKHIACKLKRRL